MTRERGSSSQPKKRESAAPRPRPASSDAVRRHRTPLARSGTAITDEVAERLADEAEAGYDLSRGRRVGRPSLEGKGVSPRVNFRTTRALHEKARRRAEREGKTISQVAREALEEYLA